MCGICGIFHFNNPLSISEVLLNKMTQRLSHRGPDAAGIWSDEKKTIGLGHRRLTILDKSDLANQPMFDNEKNVVVVLNGEIYNHGDLRQELIEMGAGFMTQTSDTEILIEGYKKWGWVELLDKINGMFAFALWDVKKQKLYLARDRLGIKPLYIHTRDGQLIFASEIKAILESKKIERKINLVAMYHYLTGMAAPSPITMFDGVQKLPAATYCSVDKDGVTEVRKYWDHHKSSTIKAFKTRPEAVRFVKEKFTEAVNLQMAADVPVGVFLSGGVDSTSILAAMSKRSAEPVKTFTVLYPGYDSFNESEEAASVAAYYGADHREVFVTQKNLESAWLDIVQHQDEPLGDWVCLPLYFVAKAASEEVKVVLVGEGADEIFLGYSSYLRHMRAYSKYWIPFQRFTPSVVKTAIALCVPILGKLFSARPALIDYILRAAREGQSFLGGATTFFEFEKNQLLKKTELIKKYKAYEQNLIDEADLGVFDTEIIASSAQLSSKISVKNYFKEMVNLELLYRLPELLLMRSDKMTMAHSLEARFPFLDHELVATVYNQSDEWKCIGDKPKALLKDAMHGSIPKNVIERAKVGFGAPISEWLKSEYGHKIEKEIFASKLINNGCFNPKYIKKLFDSHRSGRMDNSAKIWLLYNLTSWHSVWIDPDKMVCS